MRYLSVCSGIEAATAAWHPLGWDPVGFCEIEPFPSAVLAHHFPGVPNYGDFTQIVRDPTHPVRRQRVDLLVGGTPCQDFSVAGLRAGLDGKRGQLTLEFFRLAAVLNPEWIVWENVPGVLSQDGGRAFGTILGALDELGFGWAYRVLDAQYVRVDGYPRAVPQRRRRVFVVGCRGGDWERAERVLLEPEGVLGHSPPRRKARAGASGAAAGGAGGDGGARAGGYTTSDGAVNALDSMAGGADDNDARGNRLIMEPQSFDWQAGGGGNDASFRGGSRAWIDDPPGRTRALIRNKVLAVLEAYGGNDTRGALDVATACRAKGGSGHGDFESETFLVQAAVEAYQQHGSNVGPMGTLRRGNGNEQGGVPFMVDDGVAHTLRAEGHDASEDGTGRGVPLTVCSTGRGWWDESASAATLRSQESPNKADTLTIDSERPRGRVCRLTPLECERLQGFPEGWTLIPTAKRNHCDPEQIAYLRRQRPNLTDAEIVKLAADGPRYKAIGNSMAVNVMRWLGTRIARVASTKELR